MKITDIKTHFVQSDIPTSEYGLTGWLFTTIHTDEGITGIGESGAWGFLETSEQAIQTFRQYLIGENPLRRDHHWQYLYRNSHFRGAALMGALSAIDIALWDIAGKHYNAPVYELLGGKNREKARTYVHIFGDTIDTLVDRCVAAKDDGFTAVGHLSPLLDTPRDQPYSETHAEFLTDAANRVRRFREAVGTDVDLCIEIHRRLKPHQAIALAGKIEPYNPMFYEDPIRPENFDAMAHVADQTRIPIATGERLHTSHEFEMLLRRNAVDYIRPNVCLAGGLTHTKKIAGIAEAHYVDVVPHNPLSPVCTAASLQLGAAIPNFGIQEFPYRPDKGRAPGRDILTNPLEFEDGYLFVPDGPGIGVELTDEALADTSYESRDINTRTHEDGSVVDQ